jgi:hypothetical protein
LVREGKYITKLRSGVVIGVGIPETPTAHPAEAREIGRTQGTIQHSGNIQRTFREHSENIKETFSEHSVNIQRPFREYSRSAIQTLEAYAERYIHSTSAFLVLQLFLAPRVLKGNSLSPSFANTQLYTSREGDPKGWS